LYEKALFGQYQMADGRFGRYVSRDFYLQRGYIEPGIAFPIMVGVLGGALTGAKLLKHLNVSLLRKIFAVAILLVAVNMIYNGLMGKF